MQIKFLHIKNFKSIQELKIADIENSLILVGKNNTGKTAVLDAIRLATGNYEVEERNFNEKKQNIEILMTLEITEEELQQFHRKGIVSSYKRYDAWKRDFCEKIPSFSNGEVTFLCSINHNGKIRYEDGFHKNNHYIKEILPKLHFIDTNRNITSFQEDLLLSQKSEELASLYSGCCIFDSAKDCTHCFQCIGLINQKKPEQLKIHETARLLEYKMYKYMSFELKDREMDASKNYYKQPTIPKEVAAYQPPIDYDELLADLNLNRLHEIFQATLKRQEDKIDPIRSQFGKIEKDEINVDEKNKKFILLRLVKCF